MAASSSSVLLGVVFLCFTTLLSPTCAGPLTWTQVRSDGQAQSPPARRDAGLGYDAARNRLILFGGRDAGGVPLQDTWVYNISSDAWTMLPLVPGSTPSARYSFVAGVSSVQAKFVIATGEGSSPTFKNDVWAFDLATDTWSELVPALTSGSRPDPRYGAGGGIFNTSSDLFVTHGFSSRRYSDTFAFNIVTNEWRQVHGGVSEYNPSQPHSRCLFGSAMISSRSLALFGGCMSGGKSAGPCPTRDAWVLVDGSWENVPAGPSARQYSAMALAPGSASLAVLYGGSEKSRQIIQIDAYPEDEVDVMDTVSMTWTRVRAASGSPGFPSKRNGHSMVTAESGVFMFGGFSETKGGAANDLWLLSGDFATAERYTGVPKWFNFAMLHGIFMFIGWGVCLQAGAFIARFFKHRDPWWFHWHRRLQIGGLVLGVIGVVFAIVSVQGAHFMFAHGAIGLVITILGLLQPLNAYFRPHKHTPRRRLWNYVHWTAGRLALLLALVNISLGLMAILAPTGLWATWFALLAAYVTAFAYMEVRTRHERPKYESSSVQVQGRLKGEEPALEMGKQ